MLWGRYPGDSYAGGNPWTLLSSIIAEYYYKCALNFQMGENHALTSEMKSKWRKIVSIEKEDFNALELAQA